MDNEPQAIDTTDAELLDWLQLSLVAGVGPRMLAQLLDEFGSAGAVLDAAPSRLRAVAGIGPKLSDAIAGAREVIDVQEELKLCADHGIEILTTGHEAYPRVLREIPDPPPTLFVWGRFQATDDVAIAIVGTRHATRYGTQQAERLGRTLARSGMTVVSGLARGIDVAAHRAALEAGGRTVAVVAGGLLNLYPPEHQEIAAEIAHQGVVVSESPPRLAPSSGTFPQRNRIISGLSLGTIIVEAAERSGALITAQHAMEQGREVFAVPGPVTSRASRGCHRLIRDGARLVESADDVLEELGPLVEASTQPDGTVVRHPAELQLNATEQQVLQAISSEATSIDGVVQRSRLPVQRVLSTISVLEMRRLVVRISGNQVARR